VGIGQCCSGFVPAHLIDRVRLAQMKPAACPRFNGLKDIEGLINGFGAEISK
jgi:hypothetical protein